MWAALAFALVVFTAFVTSRISARQATRIREEEERGRRERRDALSALESKYLKEGIEEAWSNQFPDYALQSLGNVAYLVWLLNYEPKFRSYREEGKNAYPPDWEWRRRFVFLRDRGICQGCKKDSSQGTTLDCHHIKPISQFGSDEVGIHSLSNLISLCPHCHAGQHLGNRILAERASRSSMRNQIWNVSAGKNRVQRRKLISPEAIDVQPSSEVFAHRLPGVPLDHEIKSTVQSASEEIADSKAKSITDGLEWIEKRISDMESQNAKQLCNEVQPSPPIQAPKPSGSNLKKMEELLEKTNSPTLRKFLQTQIATAKMITETRNEWGPGARPDFPERAITKEKPRREGEQGGLDDETSKGGKQIAFRASLEPPARGMTRHAASANAGSSGRTGGIPVPFVVVKSLTESPAKTRDQIPEATSQDAGRFLDEEDKHGRCDYCDKEILIDTHYVSDKGMYLCERCYSSTGGKE